MDDLSPAAQAVRRAFAQIMQELNRHCQVSVSFTDTLPITLETNDASLQAAIDSLCAAALRAAVDQVVPEYETTPGGSNIWPSEPVLSIRAEFLAIATELEGAQ